MHVRCLGCKDLMEGEGFITLITIKIKSFFILFEKFKEVIRIFFQPGRVNPTTDISPPHYSA